MPSIANTYWPNYIRTVDTLTLCPLGTYGVMAAGTSQAQACATCDAGYFCGVLGTISSTKSLCPVGGYCPAGSSFALSCPAGTLSLLSGQSSDATCATCPRGFYCPSAGTSSLSSCPLNFFCPAGTSNFLSSPCPGGTYGTSTGLYSSTQCQNCTIGSYCVSGASPVSCPVGTYNPFQGGSSSTSCLPCQKAFACPSTGMTAMTTLCAPGYYCPMGTTFATQYPCPSGTYSDSTMLTQQSECTPCPPGFRCNTGTSTSTLATCIAGYYCPLGTALGNEVLRDRLYISQNCNISLLCRFHALEVTIRIQLH